MTGEPLGEREHVPRLRGAKRVQDLVVIAHAADVSGRPGQQGDQGALGLVGVLELVHEEPFPALAVEREPMRMLGQQPDREREQVVEIPRVRAMQLDLQLAPHRGDQRRRTVPGRLLVAVG